MLGSFMQRLTGLGFALIVSPLLALLLGPIQGVVATNAFGAVSSGIVFFLHLREVEYRKILPLLMWAAVGTLPGMAMVRIVPRDVLLVSAGVLTILALLLSVFARRLGKVDLRGGLALGGSLSGFMNIVAGVGGPALAAYAVISRWDQLRFAITAQFYFTALAIISLVGRGVMPEIAWAEVAAGGTGVLLGLVLARLAGRRVSGSVSRVLCLVLAAAGGIAVIVSGLAGMSG